MLPSIRKVLALLFLALALVPRGAFADAASAWADVDDTAVRLVSAVRGAGDRDVVPMGLHFRLEKGWKIYWRSPGDAGFPPQPDWSGSTNLDHVDIDWPAPERFSILGIDTLGYKDEVVLPLAVHPVRPGEAVGLRVSIDYLACSDICIPHTVDLAFSLPAGPAEASSYAHLIERWQSRVPSDGAAVGLEVVSAEAAEPTLLRVAVRSNIPLERPDVFVEGPRELFFDPPVFRPGADGRTAMLDIPVGGLEEFGKPLENASLTLTLVDGNRGAEKAVVVQPPSGATPPEAAGADGTRSVFVILLLALVGGLILNLMPCVLPVISLKTIGVIKHGGGDPRMVRISFLASAAGILVSFLALAGALVALKAGGMAIGWGIQFQQPWFLAAMTVVVVLFACNLWGFFEVGLPGWIADAGEHASHVRGLGGHFLSGMLATLLATPCSAPFLGTAVGFALSRGTVEILAVFFALGLGLALPYLLVAAAPGMATMLPRPGRWMAVLKQILGFALAATAVWLLGVMVTQMGTTGASTVGALTVALAVALYLAHRRPRSLGRLGHGAAVLFAVGALAGAVALDNGGPPHGDPTKGLWRPFDEAAIPGLVANGKTVFVDVTAEWCITCQVNKAVALGNAEVMARLTSEGVVAMQADWTRPSDVISAYLEKFGRYGIPFNAVYGPGSPDGKPLPELLTPGLVLDALDAAKSR